MEKERLLQSLEELRVELARTDRVDPATLAQFEQLTTDVRRALDESDEAAPDDDATSGLRDLMLRYEADHPQLSAAVGRVADALAAMGI